MEQPTSRLGPTSSTTASRGQLRHLGPAPPGVGPRLRRLGAIGPGPAAPQLALNRGGMAAQPPRRLRGAAPRPLHLLDPDTLLETKPPCHTGNLHRLVVANTPAIMADPLQPPVESAGILRNSRLDTCVFINY